MNEHTLSMPVLDLLNEARRSGGAAMLDVPSQPTLTGGTTPPALVVAVCGNDVQELRRVLTERFGFVETHSDSGLIVSPYS